MQTVPKQKKCQKMSATPFSDAEQKLILALTPDPVPDEVRREANRFSMEFQHTAAGLEWAVTAFPVQQNSILKRSALLIIKTWCKYHWAEMPQGAAVALKQALFVLEPLQAHLSDVSFRNNLTTTQVAFMWRTYPQDWPSFWQDVFGGFNEEQVLWLVDAFCDYSKGLNAAESLLFTVIKDGMRADGNDHRVTQFVAGKMAAGNNVAFKCFAELCSWVNVQYLMQQDTLNAINGGFRNPETIVSAFATFVKLVTRHMPVDVKYQLIEALNIPGHVAEVLSNGQMPTAVQAVAARLVNATGLELLKSPKVQEYIGLALQFLVAEEDEVSEAVFPFVLDFVKSYQGSALAVLEKVLPRLAGFFEMFTDDHAYMERITMISHSAIQADPEKTLTFLAGVVNAPDFWTASLPRCAAVMQVATEYLSGGEPKQVIGFFVEKLHPITSMTPPFNEVQSYAVLCYVKFFVAVQGMFSGEEHASIFSNLCQLASNPQVGEEKVRKEFAGLLVLFVKKLAKNKQLTFDPAVIYHFVGTLDAQLVSVAAMLLRTLPEAQQSEIFGQCMQHLLTSLQNSPNKMKDSEIVLSFIRSLRYTPNAPHIPKVAQIMGEMFSMCITDDQLLVLYIRTLYSSLSDQCMQQLMQCVEHAKGPLSLGGLSEAATALLKSEQLDPNTWCPQFMGAVLPKTFAIFRGICSWERSEETKEVLDMMCNFLKFCATVLVRKATFPDEHFQQVHGFLLEIFNSMFDLPELVAAALDITSSLLEVQPEMVFREIAPLVLNSIFSPKFDPWKKEWFSICKCVMQLHCNMKNKNGEMTLQVITEMFKKINVQDRAMIDSYLQLLCLELPRQRVAQCRTFFPALVKFRASQGV